MNCHFKNPKSDVKNYKRKKICMWPLLIALIPDQDSWGSISPSSMSLYFYLSIDANIFDTITLGWDLPRLKLHYVRSHWLTNFPKNSDRRGKSGESQP